MLNSAVHSSSPLQSEIPPLDASIIEDSLRDTCDAKVLYFETTPTTMRVDELSNSAGVSPAAWQIYVAGLQVDGKGVTGPWKQTAKDVAMTLLAPEARSEDENILLRVAAGLSVIEALRDNDGGRLSGLWLKWPNDIFYGRKKIAGMLSQGSFENVHNFYIPEGLRLIGVGINLSPDVLSQRAKKMGEDICLSEIATSFETLTGSYPHLGREGIITRFVYWFHTYSNLVRSEKDSFVQLVNAHLAQHSDSRYLFEWIPEERILEGHARSLSAEGLTIELAGGGLFTAPLTQIRRFYLPGTADL